MQQSLSSGRMDCGKRLIPMRTDSVFAGCGNVCIPISRENSTRQPSAVPISPVSAPRTTARASSKDKGVPTSRENGIPPAPFIPLRQITEPTLGAADSKPSMMSRQRLRGTGFSLLERTQHCPSCFSTISDQSFPAPPLAAPFPYLSNLLDVSIVFDSRI